MGIRDRLRKLERTYGDEPPPEDPTALVAAEWLARIGEPLPEVIRRLLTVPLRPQQLGRGFTQAELNAAGVDLTELLKELAKVTDPGALERSRRAGPFQAEQPPSDVVPGPEPDSPVARRVGGETAEPGRADGAGGEDAGPDHAFRRRPKDL